MKDQTEFSDYELNELRERFGDKLSIQMNGTAHIVIDGVGALGTIEWPDLLYLFEFCQNSLSFLHFDIYTRENEPGDLHIEIYEV